MVGVGCTVHYGRYSCLAMKPRLLDLFCGAGGAAVGYHRAGFEVVGVDIAPQPHFPFEFMEGDALTYLRRAIESEWLWQYDAVHASPPCQHFTKYGNSVKDIKDRYEDLLGPTRELLKETGLPYVIENVEGAPLVNPLKLCGSMFEGAGTNDLQRHRLFETNWAVLSPGKCDHSIWGANRYPGGRSGERGGSHVLVRKTVEVGRWSIPLETQKWAMGVHWKVTVRELSEGVPPAYTEFIGRQLLPVVASWQAAA